MTLCLTIWRCGLAGSLARCTMHIMCNNIMQASNTFSVLNFFFSFKYYHYELECQVPPGVGLPLRSSAHLKPMPASADGSVYWHSSVVAPPFRNSAVQPQQLATCAHESSPATPKHNTHRSEKSNTPKVKAAISYYFFSFLATHHDADFHGREVFQSCRQISLLSRDQFS